MLETQGLSQALFGYAMKTLLRQKDQLIIVKGAPHFGVMFDTDDIRNKVMSFLKKQLN